MENFVDVVSDICKGGLWFDVFMFDIVVIYGMISDVVEICGLDELCVVLKFD